ncbi:MAG: hypothetical protein MNPFHGCM_02520 [Gemmatimonadaceae bacterium]|nr:hypothetical protein [Gemmatimonadaceae bacterium]
MPLPAQRPAIVRPELRLDVIAAPATTVETGIGLARAFATYTRLVGIVAAGTATRNGSTVAAYRAELAARFVLDPFWQSRWSLYGVGGISAMYDAFDDWRPIVTVAVGLEGPRKGSISPAFELGVGGGFRFAGVLRFARGDLR